jgi:hypothetical protein
MSAERAKLGGAFAAPDRTGGIGPPAARRVPEQLTPVQEGLALAPGGAVADARFAAGAPQRVAPDRAVVYLTQGVHARLKRYVEGERRKPARRDARGRLMPKPSYTSVVLEAVEAEHARLAEIVGNEQAPATSLFAPREPQRRVHGELQVQVTLTPGAANVGVLDGLVKGLGTSRSALVDQVLDVWLPQSRRRQGKDGILDASAG